MLSLGLRSVLFVVVVSAFFVASQRSETLGCAAVGPKGAPVQILDEDAIIVYDSTKKTQHFIRRANFRTPSANFGFLVPTPSVPKLTEVEDAAFGILGRHILPKVREVSGGYEFDSWLFSTPAANPLTGSKSDVMKSAEKKDVKVLAEARVGGFNAVVLEAGDPAALEQWLKKNEYPTTPELSSWLGPYLAQKWKISAFKIEKDPKSGLGVVSTKAVKMSFAADRPFFPYREPDVKVKPAATDDGDIVDDRRILRVFFLGNSRMAGALGKSEWKAETVWADAIDAMLTDSLAKELNIPREEFPTTPWLTAFKDGASPRPGAADVFFDASPDKSAKLPPEMVVTRSPTIIPLELVFLGVLVIGAILYVAVRKLTRAKR